MSTNARRTLVAAGLAGAVLLACFAAPAEARARTKPTSRAGGVVKRPAVARATAAPARPDAELFREAQAAETTLRKAPRRMARRGEWESVIVLYRRVVARFPRSGYCDNALFSSGSLYREMARRFGSTQYRDDAAAAYRTLVAEYPSSSLGDDALWAVVELARGGDRSQLGEAARAYLDAYPEGTRARAVKALLRQREPAAPLPAAPPPGLARVFDLRAWSGESSTRVVVDLERRVPIRSDVAKNPDRLWIDLVGARLHPNLEKRVFPVGDGLLEQVRVGKNRDDVVRIVLDFKDVWEHNVFFLDDPTRLVIDVRGGVTPSAGTALVASAAASPAAAAQLSTPAQASPVAQTASVSQPAGTVPRPVAPVPESGSANPQSASPATQPTTKPQPATSAPLPGSKATAAAITRTPSPATPAAAAAAGLPPLPVQRRVDATAPSPPKPTPPEPLALVAVRERPAHARQTAAVEPAVEVVPPTPEPPAVNRAGSYSLARQLGLGARRIVIDAGHGGHDPGTIGRRGLQEKELVLDVGLRLARLVREELGTEVVLTRSSDVFIPLEERTAVANSRGADLFLSIHANASRNPGARGIETYFLNFARNAHAEAVAARENAISPATLKDLQSLVKAITLNSKIDESRDFAAAVQEHLVSGVRAQDPVPDRGVHTAPFYVLIGANMPAILAEIAFLSNPEDEKRLRTPEYRDVLARSLLRGVRSYLEALNRTQTRQLTQALPRPTVAAGRGSR